MRKVILLLIMGSWSLSSFAQHLDSILVDKHYYPAPTLANLIIMANISTLKWEAEMKTYGFINHTFSEGMELFYTSFKEPNGKECEYGIVRNPKNVGISLTTKSNKLPFRILDTTCNTLTPYFLDTEKGTSFYRFKLFNTQYLFKVVREDNSEMIIIEKSPPSNVGEYFISVDSISTGILTKNFRKTFGTITFDNKWSSLSYLDIPQLGGKNNFKIIGKLINSPTGNSSNGVRLIFYVVNSKGEKGVFGFVTGGVEPDRAIVRLRYKFHTFRISY